MKKTLKRNLGQLGALSFGAAMLVACGDNASTASSAKDDPNQLVECFGVGKNGDGPVTMPKQICAKLPSTKQEPVKSSDYVQCYGVAAAGKNDCATNTTSCGGSAKETRQPDAWVSIPKGICENLKGSSIGKPVEVDKKQS